MTLFGHIHIGRMDSGLATKTDLLEMEKRIMAKQSEITADVTALAAQAAAQTLQLAGFSAGLLKVGAETDGLQAIIVKLQTALDNQDNASPALVDAVAALKQQFNNQSAAIDDASSKLTVVDDKVPDAPAPPA